MSQELAVYQPAEISVATSDFMPIFDITRAVQRRDILVEFTKRIMNDGLDFGTVPGSSKKSLLKPGAEKLCTFFGLVPGFVITQETEDWTGEQHMGEPFFYYRYKCRLLRNGQVIGEGEGSCNTWESKYRYRWVSEFTAKASGFQIEHLTKRGGRIWEFTFAVEKAQTSGKYGKPAEHWQAFKDAIANRAATKTQKPMGAEKKMADAWEIDSTEYRVPNPDVADQVNTCQKMAQKRALVAAVLIAVNASEYFTQDIEDFEPNDPTPTPPHHDPEPESEPKAKAQTAQTIAPGIPTAVQGMYAKMLKDKKDGFAEVFNYLYKSLCEFLGDVAGPETYSEILGQHGVQSWQNFAKLGDGKKCVLALYNKIQELGASRPSVSESEPVEGELFEVGA